MTAPYHPQPPSISAQPSSASPSHHLTCYPKRQFSQDSSNLNHHSQSSQVIPSVTNKKKHVCHICSKAFTTSGHLSRHARIHTGERNHKCPFPGCDTRCSRQDNLQQQCVLFLILYTIAKFADSCYNVSYRIHLTPGSRRNSASTRSQILSGNKKHVKALPPPPEVPLDSPPSTPPALEFAIVPRVYETSESSPLLSALSHPPMQEYVKQDYQDAEPTSHYFDPRGSPHRAFDAGHPPAPEELLSPTCPSLAMPGLRRGSCDNTSGNERALFPPQNHIYVPSSGPLVMTGSHAINGMSNTTTYPMYGTYVPPAHPPPNHAPPSQSSNTPMRVDVSLVQPQPRDGPNGTHSQLPYSSVPSNQPHRSPVTSSPSPVSSLSLSSHNSEHSPSLYQKRHLPIAVPNGMPYPPRGPPQATQLQANATEHYHPSNFIPTEEVYSHGSTTATAPWQNSLHDAKGMSAPHGGVGYFL